MLQTVEREAILQIEKNRGIIMVIYKLTESSLRLTRKGGYPRDLE